MVGGTSREPLKFYWTPATTCCQRTALKGWEPLDRVPSIESAVWYLTAANESRQDSHGTGVVQALECF